MSKLDINTKNSIEYYELQLKDIDNYYNKQQCPKYPSNTFIADKTLQKYLEKLIPEEIYNRFYTNLVKYGEKCGSIYPSKAKEGEIFKPVFEKYDATGK